MYNQQNVAKAAFIHDRVTRFPTVHTTSYRAIQSSLSRSRDTTIFPQIQRSVYTGFISLMCSVYSRQQRIE